MIDLTETLIDPASSASLEVDVSPPQNSESVTRVIEWSTKACDPTLAENSAITPYFPQPIQEFKITPLKAPHRLCGAGKSASV